ncbi:DUF1033 family protein [Macrococcus bovicus]|uniref:DUF1033 family protein n=1 Tax=Macrococcus bovicus TaxID=69968 RepID=A0A4R6C251_9STAP|nr:DUF1033 family protein [Macrococcus bovicus]TDM15400.1 DUF1033 family protein [Macrococcus bovicus]WJP96793.1 DUF1033 family protein [Macrococcus bovicus]
MWEVIIMRADYEGWWLFEDWRDHIIHQEKMDNKEMFENVYKQHLEVMRDKFKNEVVGKYNIHAFYNNCELHYCEDCEEDLQIFYSLIALKNGEIYYDKVKL